jgi:hypothetical protein
MMTVALIPPDPAHTPASGAQRVFLYPLWVLRLEIRTLRRSDPRVLYFSVDGLRSVPLPVRRMPDVLEQEVPDSARVPEGVDRRRAESITRKFARGGIGRLPGLFARLQVTDAKKVYKLFWIVGGRDETPALIDSRSGKRIPMPPRDGEVPAGGGGSRPASPSDAEPFGEEEVEPTDQNRDASHDRVAERGAE